MTTVKEAIKNKAFCAGCSSIGDSLEHCACEKKGQYLCIELSDLRDILEDDPHVTCLSLYEALKEILVRP